jgi:hypothetical protein
MRIVCSKLLLFFVVFVVELPNLGLMCGIIQIKARLFSYGGRLGMLFLGALGQF